MIFDQRISRLRLPEPDEVALGLSADLQKKIHFAIMENGGSISFEQYMQMSLYEPGLGYYSAGSSKFGEQGDFVTAPELSPVFSRCLANQCRQILLEITSGCILELGPGTGVMAIDIMRELERKNILPEVYYMLEPSADLRQRQKQKVKSEIPHLRERMVWLERLPEEEIEGIILANEVVDAMPVRRIEIDHEFLEIVVTSESGAGDQVGFKWNKKAIDQTSMKVVQKMLATLKQTLSMPYTLEINFYIKPWLNSLGAVLNKGLILISDYGYPRKELFHPQRRTGTLACHYRHHVHDDPFLYPGLQDITASVDFTAIAEAAADVDLHVAGFTTQAHFLIACGLDPFVLEQETDDVAERTRMTHQISKLTMPDEMGEKFKFIGLTKSLDIQLQGFSFIDQRARL